MARDFDQESALQSSIDHHNEEGFGERVSAVLTTGLSAAMLGLTYGGIEVTHEPGLANKVVGGLVFLTGALSSGLVLKHAVSEFLDAQNEYKEARQAQESLAEQRATAD